MKNIGENGIKMGKRYPEYAIDPMDICKEYGADTLRLYEMFLGPIQQSKPWDTGGIEGVYKFLKKLWKLFFNVAGEFEVSDAEPNEKELKALHKTIKKVESDIESFSYNTSVSTFMICVNELTSLKCNKRQILEPLVVALSPFAPHICEELWKLCGHKGSIIDAQFPVWDEKLTLDNTKTYPVAINGKTKFTVDLPADASAQEVENQIRNHQRLQPFVEGKTIKKVIVVPGKMVNFVVI